MNPDNYLFLSALLFTIGAFGVLIRRNAIVVFMCIELMLNAVNLSLVTFSRLHGDLTGQVIAFFTMVVAAPRSWSGWPSSCPCSVPAARLRSTTRTC